MATVSDYSFRVEIWQSDDQFNWVVAEEINGETTPLGMGVSDSYLEAARLASEVVLDFFKQD